MENDSFYFCITKHPVQILAWVSFTMMTKCAPAGIFAVAGAYQMIVWALGKHRNYKGEFKVGKLIRVNDILYI